MKRIALSLLVMSVVVFNSPVMAQSKTICWQEAAIRLHPELTPKAAIVKMFEQLDPYIDDQDAEQYADDYLAKRYFQDGQYLQSVKSLTGAFTFAPHSDHKRTYETKSYEANMRDIAAGRQKAGQQ